MSSNILVFEARPRQRRSAWLVSAYGGEWEDKYERPLAVYATRGEAIRAAEAYEAEGHDDLYCDGYAEGAYVYEVEGESRGEPKDPTCRIQDTDHEFEDSVRCDRCHATFNRPWEPFRYCPNCGARVVSGDE